MKDKYEETIDSLLASIKGKLGKERVPRLEARARDVWSGTGKTPFLWAVTEPLECIRNFPEMPPDEDRRDLLLYLTLLNNYLDYGSDFYPAVQSGLRQATLPSLFGCEEYDNGVTSTVIGVVKSVSDIYSLRAEWKKDSIGVKMLEKMKYMYNRTGLPLYITDMQGPFSVACHVAGFENLVELMADEPEAVHELMKKATDATVEYFEKMFELTDGNLVPLHCHPMVYMPQECGVAVSDDYLAIVSASMTEEFSAPYLEQIGERFGGVVVHSCGDIGHQLSLLNDVRRLKGVNFSATETDLENAMQTLRKDILILTHNSPVTTGNLPLLSQEEHLQRAVELTGRYGRKTVIFSVGFDASYPTYANRERLRAIAGAEE